jgi:FemAB-related protein (PEP-CTERM system-associated)
MDIILYQQRYRQQWDNFVLQSPHSTAYHQIAWKDVIEKSFRQRAYYLMCMNNNQISGVFPLVFMKSLLFGRFMVSLPFFNYGGLLCENADARQALMDKAVALSKQLNVRHIEIRERADNLFDLPKKTSKVSLYLSLPASSDELWKSFKSKLRSQIKRPIKEGMEVRVGGLEELDNFYEIFAINMRDLGTPVYTKRFFHVMLTAFPKKIAICSVYLNHKAVGGAFLVGFRDTLEVPWASTLRQYNALSPNMLLYWGVLKYACEMGYKRFDFGRSTPDSGTYHFKKQWGAQPAPLHWYYWLNKGQRMPELNPQNKKFNLLIKAWQKLPVEFANLIGPRIVRGLPS